MTGDPPPRVRGRLMLAAALGLWLISLVLPAIEVGGARTLSGGDVLLEGFTAWRQGVFSWFANPLFLLAVAAGWYRFDRAAAALAVLAVALALTSLRAAQIARAGGAPVPDFAYASGFYVWLAAHCTVLLGSAAGLLAGRNVAQS